MSARGITADGKALVNYNSTSIAMSVNFTRITYVIHERKQISTQDDEHLFLAERKG